MSSKKSKKNKLSTVPKTEVLGEYYHHIENGGLTLKVTKHNYLNEHDNTLDSQHQLEVDISHIGIGSKIEVWDFGPNTLRKLADMLKSVAEKMEKSGVENDPNDDDAPPAMDVFEDLEDSDD